ncbi:MAG: hypothetical protein E3J66_04535 [Dehalococcoidia bacterium]|nr:MAG: hypothetical protein E3J66_04535 [Dehalococcoidia bacterium]
MQRLVQIAELIPSDLGEVDVFAYAPEEFQVVSYTIKQPKKTLKAYLYIEGCCYYIQARAV